MSQVSEEPDTREHGVYQTLYQRVAPEICDIAQVPLIKESLVYQLAADKFHVVVVGPPSASAKSTTGELSMRCAPSSGSYSYAGDSTEKVGVSEALQRAQRGLFFIDEIGMAKGDYGILFDLLQYQKIKIDKHQKHREVDLPVNVYATCNPEDGNKDWVSYGNPAKMRQQIPFNSAMHRRFHVTIATEKYSDKHFDKVNRHKAKIKAREKPPVTQDELEEARRLVTEMRNYGTHIPETPDFVYDILKWLRAYDNQQGLVHNVTNELMEGFQQASMANARLRYKDADTITKTVRDKFYGDKEREKECVVVERQDWERAVSYMVRALTTGIDDQQVASQLKFDAKQSM